MKKALIAIIVLIAAAIGFFLYSTRPVEAPAQGVQSVSDTISTTSSASVYRISQDSSKAEFNIREMLSGSPKLVVGTTHQIAGDIQISGSKIAFGTMKLDARTLKTDSSSRDGAMNRFILKTDAPGNEYVVFVPKQTDLSAAVVMGQPLSFNVTGDLTISGVTKPATFAVKATASADRIVGTASTTVTRADFGIKIPNLSFLANVGEKFSVSLDIIALKVAN